MRDDLTTLDDAFGHWLAGFTDGEGCFIVAKYETGAGTRLACRFVIAVRADDAAILEEVHRRTGLGMFYPLRAAQTYLNRNPQAAWKVFTKSDTLGLVRLFEQYPLRAKKAADFPIWREAVYAWQRQDWPRMEVLHRHLIAGRQYDAEAVGIPPDDDRQECLPL